MSPGGKEAAGRITMESRCSSSDFDTPNYRYVVATSMGNRGVAVIARRVRGRFSVTRLLSRSVRFYFALSRGVCPSSHSVPFVDAGTSYSLIPP